MSARARAALGERDANHVAIAKRYQSHMCMVLDLSKVGGGCPDLLVRIPTRAGGILAFVEVKTVDGVMTGAQVRFKRDWGASAWVVRTELEVDDHIEVVKRQFK